MRKSEFRLNHYQINAIINRGLGCRSDWHWSDHRFNPMRTYLSSVLRRILRKNCASFSDTKISNAAVKIALQRVATNFQPICDQEGWTDQAIKFFNNAKAEPKKPLFDDALQEKMYQRFAHDVVGIWAGELLSDTDFVMRLVNAST